MFQIVINDAGVYRFYLTKDIYSAETLFHILTSKFDYVYMLNPKGETVREYDSAFSII